MEYLILFAVIVIGAILYLGGRFTNFKSQLMNELGRRGMDYQSANSLYTVMANDINKLHHEGVSVGVIADIITQINSAGSTAVTKTSRFANFDAWLDAFKQECDKIKAGVSPFLEFMTYQIYKGLTAGKDPEEIAYHFAKDFDDEYSRPMILCSHLILTISCKSRALTA